MSMRTGERLLNAALLTGLVAAGAMAVRLVLDLVDFLGRML